MLDAMEKIIMGFSLRSYMGFEEWKKKADFLKLFYCNKKLFCSSCKYIKEQYLYKNFEIFISRKFSQ